MKRLLVAVLLVVAAGAGSSAPGHAADAGTAWLHVRVEEPGKGSKVNVNLPLPVVEAALKAAPETIESEGHIHFGHHGHDMRLSDLRQAWRDLRAAGDTDIVTVEGEDGGHVTVGRRGDQVQVRVREHGDREQVAVDLPVAVVDALFSGTGEELNIRGALDELRKVRGHIVSVTDHDSRVRVWIDEDSSSQGAR
jgi:hypothetical protein